MAQSNEEIAKDIVVAWLSHNMLSYNTADRAKDVGVKIGEMYTAVLQAVRAGMPPGQSSAPDTPVVAPPIIMKRD